MTVFNTFAYAKKLKAAGVSENIAEVQAEGLAEAVENASVAKQDFQSLSQDVRLLKQDFQSLRQELKQDIAHLDQVLTVKITTVDTKLNWLITLIGIIGFALTLTNFFSHYF